MKITQYKFDNGDSELVILIANLIPINFKVNKINISNKSKTTSERPIINK